MSAKVFTIRVEQQEVCTTGSLSRAFLLSSYYVFELQYVKGTQSTLNFMQRILCDIANDDVRIKDTKLIGFLSKIQHVQVS